MMGETLMIMFPALVAGLLIIATHVPLGLEVLKREIIFIDLAVAQVAGLGVIVANLYFEQSSVWVTQIMALIFAIGSAYGFKLCEHYGPRIQEPMIGSVYVFASSLAFLLLAHHPHGAEKVEHLLSGQLLWVDWSQIAIAALIYGIVLFAIYSAGLLQRYFYIIFAITITISVQLAGVFLVFASLIIPAMAATLWAKHSPRIFGYVFSVIALVIGLWVSLISDFPTGPVLVCSLSLSLPIYAVFYKIYRALAA